MPGDHPDWLPDLSSAVDELFSYSAQGFTTTVTKTVTTTKTYASLQFRVQRADLLSTRQFVIDVQSIDANANIVDDQTQTVYMPLGSPETAYFAVNCAPGGQLTVKMTCVLASSLENVVCLGVTGPSLGGTKLLRKDGRQYPEGDFSALINVASGSGTFIAAPGAGLSVMLASLTVAAALAASAQSVVLSLTATINGVAQIIAAAWGGPSAGSVMSNNIPPQGLLLDVNTAVTYSVGGTILAGDGMIATAFYDIVT